MASTATGTSRRDSEVSWPGCLRCQWYVSGGDGFVEAILEAGRTLFFDGFIFEFVLILFGGGGCRESAVLLLFVLCDQTNTIPFFLGQLQFRSLIFVKKSWTLFVGTVLFLML